jgi:hypothetical protein
VGGDEATAPLSHSAPSLREVRRVGALVLVGLLALAACGDDDGDDASATTTEAATPAGTRSTDPAPEPAPRLPTAGTASCTDEGSDTAEFTPGADLLGVDLTATDAGLTVRFRLVGPVPSTGTTLWSVKARPQGGTDIQLGARLEGDTRSPFVYHFGDRIQQDVPPEAMVVGPDSIEVAYPAQALGMLRTPFDWKAESTIEVEDVDYCPGGVETTVIDDERLPFSG